MNFFGIVEDRNDPLKIGRVRFRCHGIHTDDKHLIATPDLPWAQVLLPTTSAGLSGLGTQHGLVEGSTVFGFFRDGELCQDPVVTGVAVGIPPAGYRETTTDELLIRETDKGFNDPETNTGKPVGKVPLDVGEINTNRLGRGDVKNTWIEQNQRRTEYSTSYKKAGGGKWSEPDTKAGGNYEYSAEFPYNYVEESESGSWS